MGRFMGRGAVRLLQRGRVVSAVDALKGRGANRSVDQGELTTYHHTDGTTREIEFRQIPEQEKILSPETQRRVS